MTNASPPWVATVREQLGADLRSVIHLHANGREVHYVRDDIDPAPTERVTHAFQTLMFDLVGAHRDETMNGHGDLQCVTRQFEDAVEVHVPLSPTEGVAIALDGSASPAATDTIPTVVRAIRDEIAPLREGLAGDGPHQRRRANR